MHKWGVSKKKRFAFRRNPSFCLLPTKSRRRRIVVSIFSKVVRGLLKRQDIFWPAKLNLKSSRSFCSSTQNAWDLFQAPPLPSKATRDSNLWTFFPAFMFLFHLKNFTVRSTKRETEFVKFLRLCWFCGSKRRKSFCHSWVETTRDESHAPLRVNPQQLGFGIKA